MADLSPVRSPSRQTPGPKPPDKRRSVLRRLPNAIGAAIFHLLMEDGVVAAGYVAFTALFALFPFLIVLVSLAGFLGQGAAAEESIGLALDLVPLEVANVLRPAIDDIRRSYTPGLVTFGIVLSLWFASSGLESVRHVLDTAYGVPDPPGFIRNRLQSLMLVVFVAGSIIGAMVALVGGPVIKEGLEWLAQRQLFDRKLYLITRLGIGMILLFMLTITLHLVLPAIKLRFKEVLPGTLLSVVLWVLAAESYSIYLRTLATSYSLTYGSLAGIVLTLFFFYISAVIFILGAQVNGALRRGEHDDHSQAGT